LSTHATKNVRQSHTSLFNVGVFMHH